MPSRRSPSESSFSSASALSTLSSRLSMRTPVCTRSISSMVHRYHGTWIRARLDHMDSTLDDVALWEGFVGGRLPPRGVDAPGAPAHGVDVPASASTRRVHHEHREELGRL